VGIFQVGSSILDFFTRELDIVIISCTLGLEFLGIYNISKKIPVAVYSFIQPIVSRVITPLLAEKNNNVDLVRSNFITSIKALSFISFPLYALLAILSATIISVIFGPNYLDGTDVMVAFCFIYAFNGILGISGALQIALAKTSIGFVWTIYLIISTSITYYFSSIFGIDVFLICICILALVNVFACWYIQFRQLVNITLISYINIFKRPFVCAVLCSIPFFVWRNSYSIPSSIGISFIFCSLYLCFMILSKDGVMMIQCLNTIKAPQTVITCVKKLRSLSDYMPRT
jgi:O-antigen/teichoic acid export membrane protein